jgi:galactose mutarotase-like enzyme
MLCASLRHRGEELLAQNAGVAAYVERGATMGIPLLYPWANRLAGFEYSVAGRTVEVPHDTTCIALDTNGLPIHGIIGGRIRWQLGTERAAAAMSARLSWNEAEQELFAVFPFDHDVEYRVELAEGCMTLALTIDASGIDSVPLTLGFHPYLSLPRVPRERWLIELPTMRRLELDSNQIPVAGAEASPARRFELDAEVFDDGFDQVPTPARFTAAGGERRIEVDFLDGYPCAQVFTPAGAQFICFEPMAAPANALRSGEGLRLLAPGERARLAFSVRVEAT